MAGRNGSKEAVAGRKLLTAERRRQIVAILNEHGSIAMSEICREFDVTPVTARKDLSELEQEGKLKRTYGGAVSIDQQAQTVASPNARRQVNMIAKERIARAAADLVSDGDTIFIDTGTTTLEFASMLKEKRDITIVTNDLTIVIYARDHLPEAEVVIVGGKLRRSHDYTFGRISEIDLGEIYADKAFFTTNSFMPGQGFMTEFEPVSAIKALFVEHARRRYMLMDASKVGKSSFIRFARAADMDGIVMDADPDTVVADALKCEAPHTKLIIAPSNQQEDACRIAEES